MKSVLMGAAWIGLALTTGGVPLLAQLQDNSEKQMTCDNGGNDDRARHCDIREQTLPAMGRLNVDGGQNGGVSVKGWLQSNVLVRTKVETSADTQADATNLASQVSVDTTGGQVRANGPQTGNGSWSVSYEIFVPQTTDLTLKTHNGGMNISDVRGQIHFEVSNGGVRLRRLAGDVTSGRRDDLREAAASIANNEGAGLEDVTISNDRPIRGRRPRGNDLPRLAVSAVGSRPGSRPPPRG